MSAETTEGPSPTAAEVLEIERLSAYTVRVVLGGPGPAGFTSLGVSDEACVVTFPAAGERAQPQPDPENGHWYTVRRHDAARGRITLDIVTHDGGLASAWTARARVGDELLLWTQSSWFKRPDDVRWQVVLADTAGLPACGRIIEEAPAGLRTIAVVEVPDASVEQEFAGSGGDLHVTWHHNPGVAHGDSHLERLARAVLVPGALPDGPGYVYVAGEAAATRAVRRYLRHELALPARSYGVIGYWRRDVRAWAERVERSGVDIEAVWAEAEAAGSDEEHAVDLFEERLEQVGLL